MKYKSCDIAMKARIFSNLQKLDRRTDYGAVVKGKKKIGGFNWWFQTSTDNSIYPETTQAKKEQPH